MDKKRDSIEIKKEKDFLQEIERKGKRRLKAQREKSRVVWVGLGLFGVIGWSVMVPTIIGIIIGLWLDKKWHGQISWTLTFLLLGIGLGCWNAWYWIQKERKDIEKEREE